MLSKQQKVALPLISLSVSVPGLVAAVNLLLFLMVQYSADVVGCRRSVSESITIIDTWNDDLVKTNVLQELQVRKLIKKHYYLRDMRTFLDLHRMTFAITIPITPTEDWHAGKS